MKDGHLARTIEIVTGLSVVVSLAVLILEVRGNTRALERQIMLDRASAITASLVTGPEVLEAYELVKARDGWDPEIVAFGERYGMTSTQAVAWTRFLLVLWRGFEADYSYGGASDRLAAEVRGGLAYPDQRLFWTHVRLSPEFTAWVQEVAGDLLASDPGSAPSPAP